MPGNVTFPLYKIQRSTFARHIWKGFFWTKYNVNVRPAHETVF
jgi:hypothetical protein